MFWAPKREARYKATAIALEFKKMGSPIMDIAKGTSRPFNKMSYSIFLYFHI